jgi:hypothetical protein
VRSGAGRRGGPGHKRFTAARLRLPVGNAAVTTGCLAIVVLSMPYYPISWIMRMCKRLLA